MPELTTHNVRKRPSLALVVLCAFGISISLNCRGNVQNSAAERQTPRPESSHLPLPTAEELAKLPPDGGPKFNRLIFESSPYLLQHARNPVDWFPWGDEAFARAKREGKAVFLSVGYSTCHWCHVMERESFESAEIAALLNRHFICVKVDREERPDVDKIYMAALQAQTGRGGWPMSIFLAPDRRPFWCGTYFPPEDQGRRPGFKTVIASLAGAWKDHRTDVLARAESITKELRSRTSRGAEVALNEATLRAGYTLFERTFDAEQGGFGSAPKFPRSHSFSFLLRWSLREPNSDAVAMVQSTLDHLSRGGIRDHLGGGFHRYSTDREWLLPHFEKMLYDQALLARSFLEAYQVTGRASHAQQARDILDYVLRDMTDPQGAFYSAEDADSDGEEGKFYVWHRSEIIKHLGKTDGEFFCLIYGVTEEGNFRDEATGRKTGANILHLPSPLAQVAAAHKTDATVLSKRLAQLRKKLFLLRKGRIHPLKDDTILSDWNGLMISTLAYAGQALGEDRYTRAAVKASRFITKEMMKKGRLLHRYRGGKATVEGFLDDHAFLALGLLDLYETTLDPKWLDAASNLAEAMLALFWDQETAAFHFSGADSEGLIAKTKDVYDGALPSGNSVATLVLLRLGRLTTDAKMEKAARQTLAYFSGLISKRPTAYPFMLMALDFSIGPTREITLAGTFGTPEFQSMRRAVHQRFLPRKVLAGHPGGAGASAARKLIPYLEKQVAMDGQATAYLCENYSCRLPIQSLPELEKALRDFNPPQADKPRKK